MIGFLSAAESVIRAVGVLQTLPSIALLAFIASGFEHSVANMTMFSLGVFEGSASWGQLARNLAWTVPGNMIGGGLLAARLLG